MKIRLTSAALMAVLLTASCAADRELYTSPGLPPGQPPPGVSDPTPEDPFDIGDAKITGVAQGVKTVVGAVDPTPEDLTTESVVGGVVLLAGAAWGLYKKLKPKTSGTAVVLEAETPSN